MGGGWSGCVSAIPLSFRTPLAARPPSPCPLQAAGHCIPEEDEEPAKPAAPAPGGRTSLSRPSAVLHGRRNEGLVMSTAERADGAATANGTAH